MLIAPRIVEVCWPIREGGCPPHKGYALFGALCRAGMVFHGQADTIVLPPFSELVIRCPEERAWRLAGSGLAGLDVAGRYRLVFAPASVRPLHRSSRLKAWCVTIKGKMCDNSVRDGCQDQLQRMNVNCRVQVNGRRVLWIGRSAIVGYGVQLDGLLPEDSLRVQARGIGGRTRMGCGAFVPC